MRKLSIIVFSVFLLLIAAGARTETKDLWATANCAVIDVPDFGETTCIGGEVIAPWECSPETKEIRVRGAVIDFNAYDLEGPAAALITGTNRTVQNWNMNPANGAGSDGWGTLKMTIVDADGKYYGTWEGTWAGTGFGRHLGTWTFAGHGSDGLAGLQMKGEGSTPEGADYSVFTVHIQGTQQ